MFSFSKIADIGGGYSTLEAVHPIKQSIQTRKPHPVDSGQQVVPESGKQATQTYNYGIVDVPKSRYLPTRVCISHISKKVTRKMDYYRHSSRIDGCFGSSSRWGPRFPKQDRPGAPSSTQYQTYGSITMTAARKAFAVVRPNMTEIMTLQLDRESNPASSRLSEGHHVLGPTSGVMRGTRRSLVRIGCLHYDSPC